MDRLAQRNGCRDRDRVWETGAGTIDPRILELRPAGVCCPRPFQGWARGLPTFNGWYFSDFPAPQRLAEKALTAVTQEAYSQGISSRSVDDLVEAASRACGRCVFQRSEQRPPGLRWHDRISPSEVSRLCEAIDARVPEAACRLGVGARRRVSRSSPLRSSRHPRRAVRAGGGVETNGIAGGGATSAATSDIGAMAAAGRARRLTAGRQRDAVLGVLHGEPLEIVAREAAATAAALRR